MSCPFGSAEQQAPEARQACPVARLRPEAPVTLAPQSRSGLVADFLPSCFAWLSGRPATRTPIGASRGEAAAHPGPARGAEPQLDEEHPVATFLQAAGLGQYTEALLQSGFDDMETLRDIEDGDMAELGIPRGHAVKLKRRLRELQEAPAGQPEVPQFAKEAAATSRCMVPTEKMKTAVEESWEQVQAIGSEVVGELLYQNFFKLAPDTVHLFPPEVRYRYRDWSADEGVDESDIYRSPALRKLFAKVVNAVGTAVAGLQDISRLVPLLTQLGTRHVAYGVREEHFHALGKALVTALQQALGESFTLEVEFAWTMVYGFVSSIMISGLQMGFGRATSIAKPRLRNGDEDIVGGREVYRIEQHLQKAIFGDVFAARGLTSGRSFAVKVLDREMVRRFGNLQRQDNQFCEAPLCEVRFREIMRGLEHVVQMEDHFGDQFHHFVVSELASGGDLLEALRLRPSGFKERQARPLIMEAAKGLHSLHQRGLAMQDVSLENMLLYVLDDGSWQARVCDPGQAVQFTVNALTGAEEPVPFGGYVAKDFRPPELYERQEYLATKVDAWCLGWSTFYLLAAQPMFLSADPMGHDSDWMLFQRGAAAQIFQQKCWRNALSEDAKDFILGLMQLNPRQRMSVKDALRHPWLTEGGPQRPSRNAASTHSLQPTHSLQHLAPGGHSQEFHASVRQVRTRPPAQGQEDELQARSGEWCAAATASFSAWDGENVTKRQWNFKLEESTAHLNASFQSAPEPKAQAGTDTRGAEPELELKVDTNAAGLRPPEEPKLLPAQRSGGEVPTLLHKSKAIKERAALSREAKRGWPVEGYQGRRCPLERKANEG
mmetsp:Transcript_50740/g.162383  ORF Transcript_50740/g.162383 Transcript_50740/m.162383 type:complete len:832 (-) Transcript_50740:110-2605(-)